MYLIVWPPWAQAIRSVISKSNGHSHRFSRKRSTFATLRKLGMQEVRLQHPPRQCLWMCIPNDADESLLAAELAKHMEDEPSFNIEEGTSAVTETSVPTMMNAATSSPFAVTHKGDNISKNQEDHDQQDEHHSRQHHHRSHHHKKVIWHNRITKQKKKSSTKMSPIS